MDTRLNSRENESLDNFLEKVHMASPKLHQSKESIGELWSREFNRFLRFAIPLLCDSAIHLLVLLIVLVFFGVFQLIRMFGVEEKDLFYFEKADLWGSFALFAILVLHLVVRVFQESFGGGEE